MRVLSLSFFLMIFGLTLNYQGHIKKLRNSRVNLSRKKNEKLASRIRLRMLRPLEQHEALFGNLRNAWNEGLGLYDNTAGSPRKVSKFDSRLIFPRARKIVPILIPESVIEEITNRISKSVDKVITDQREGLIETEPTLTDRLLANVERDFEDQVFPSNDQIIRIKARTLRDRGPDAAEHKYGADLATVLNVDINDYTLNKTILAQSKAINSATIRCTSLITSPYDGRSYYLPNPYQLSNITVEYEKTGTIEFSLAKPEFGRLQEQCGLMLEVTPDSYVYLYCPDDIYVVPACAIGGRSRTGKRVQFYCKNLKAFFADYLKSFVGDMRLKGTTDEDFEALITYY